MPASQRGFRQRAIPMLAGRIREQPWQSGDFRLTLLTYWRIGNKRKWLILSILGTFVLGALKTDGDAALHGNGSLADRSQRGQGGRGRQHHAGRGRGHGVPRTQYELLKSRAMAERVASALRLGDDADFFKPRQFSIMSALRGYARCGGCDRATRPRTRRHCRAALPASSRAVSRCAQFRARGWST